MSQFQRAVASITLTALVTSASFSLPVVALGGHSFIVVDDGIMGGKSAGFVSAEGSDLIFSGRINTDGGGFSSCKSQPDLKPLHIPPHSNGVRLRYRGDSKLYKFTLRDGRGGPVYQHDLPTAGPNGECAVRTAWLRFDDFLPSYRGRAPPVVNRLVASEINTAGFMLSLKDSRGERNPAFGKGEFGFHLRIEEMEFCMLKEEDAL
jgi:hypothetical protein